MNVYDFCMIDSSSIFNSLLGWFITSIKSGYLREIIDTRYSRIPESVGLVIY